MRAFLSNSSLLLSVCFEELEECRKFAIKSLVISPRQLDAIRPKLNGKLDLKNLHLLSSLSGVFELKSIWVSQYNIPKARCRGKIHPSKISIINHRESKKIYMEKKKNSSKLFSHIFQPIWFKSLPSQSITSSTRSSSEPVSSIIKNRNRKWLIIDRGTRKTMMMAKIFRKLLESVYQQRAKLSRWYRSSEGCWNATEFVFPQPHSRVGVEKKTHHIFSLVLFRLRFLLVFRVSYIFSIFVRN